MSVLVIAEPGCTHEKDYAAIVRLIHVAAECGANVFKNQWVSNPRKMCERRNAHEYRAFYDWLNYPLDWHLSFQRICGELGMDYACSVYLPEDVEEIAPFVKYLKISSFEANDPKLRSAAVDAKRKIIISTGMVDEDELYILRFVATYLLQCTSAYPAPIDELHLDAIGNHGFDGLSDHSRSVIAGAVAVGSGAKVVETHFRLDDCSPSNPDFAVAFSSKEFGLYVSYIRLAERMMGDFRKRMQPSEQSMAKYRVV